MDDTKKLFGEIARILTFRASREDFAALGTRHLMVGIAATWLVGIGRYWDNPRASLLQHAGLGSLIYIVALSLLLFLLGLALRPPAWSWRHLLTFVSLTAVPGLIYAIPVEQFLDPEAARITNLCFLAVVAAWRLALYGTYLRKHARLSFLPLIVLLLLPMVAILVALSLLNLEHAVFDFMGGVQRATTSADGAYAFVIILTFTSAYIAPVLAILYVVLAARAWLKRYREAQG